jgi:23S rRNA (guanosine2251-2'-O)-methyltransferase
VRKLKNEELNRLSNDEFIKSDKSPFVIVLDNVRSANNIGSVFRTSDAFRVEKIMLCGITACPPHKEIHKTALGATESVVWEYYENTMDAIKLLKEENISIIAIEQTENSIELQDYTISPKHKYALIFGNEVNGVSQDVINECNNVIEIPQFGTKHSFNISISTGIVLWDLFQKFKTLNR